ncbi:UNVERIFIED_CONTAM: hypothetical protein GTU68_056733 [Idotea baltica]|nr:hypothetical protein [Idotea baltica]
MPLKYLAGLPDAVRVIGMLHGILFISYALLGAYLLEKLGWSYIKLIIACIIASIPFGPFIFERQLFSEISAK